MGENGLKLYIKAILNIVFVIAMTVLCIYVIPKIWSILIVLLIGWIISVIAKPIVQFLEKRLKIKRTTGSAAVILFVIAMIVFFLFVGIVALFKEGMKLISYLPVLFENTEIVINELEQNLSIIKDFLPAPFQKVNFEIMETFKSLISTVVLELKDPAIEAVSNFALSIPTLLINIVMCILFAYYCVSDEGKTFEKAYNFLPISVQKKISILRKVFIDAIWGYCKAQLKIEVWIFGILLFGFLLLGIESPLLIALLTALTDILPVLGTGTILLPWAVIELFNRDYFSAIVLLIIWIVALIVRQLIQPKIVSDSIGLNPIPTVILLLVGYHAAGFVGMILSVPIGIIFKDLYQAGMFDTTIHSCRIICSGLEQIRSLDESSGKNNITEEM